MTQGEHRDQTYNMALHFYRGDDGYPKDGKKAMLCFNRAAELGSSEAMNVLGTIYKEGQLVNKDNRIAVDWFYRALKAKSSNYYAAYNLGTMYFYGEGVEKDADKAYEFLTAAGDLARGSNNKLCAKCAYLCGVIDMSHRKDYQSAAGYFTEAADLGNIPEAWHNLGYLCQENKVKISGGDKNKAISAACGFYENAAALGYAPSMHNLATIYSSANMQSEAKAWLRKAANKGYEPSKKLLKTLNTIENGTTSEVIGLGLHSLKGSLKDSLKNLFK